MPLGATLVLVGVASILLGCSDSVASNPQPVALTGLTLIDGTEGPPRGPVTIVVENGVVTHIAPNAAVSLPSGSRTIDLSGKWALPGFIDVHAHMPDPQHQAAVLRLLLAYGVTTARSPAAVAATGVELRERIRRGQLVGPRFLTAGPMIDAPGSLWSFAAEVSTVAEVRAEITRQAAEDVDFIKVYSRLPPELLAAAIQEAHARGLPVIGHVGRTTWQEAVQSGIDALTHSFVYGFAHSAVPASEAVRFADFYQPNPAFDPALFDDWHMVMDLGAPRFDSLVALLAQRRVAVDPNLVLAEAVAWGDDRDAFTRLETQRDVVPHTFPHPYSAAWSAAERSAARAAFPTLLAAIRVMHERGVLITTGTDLRNPWMTPGVTLHRELQLLVQAGVPASDVIRIATRNGAESLGIASETGTVEIGKAADIVILDADPQLDIANTRRIALVVAQGRVFDPAELLRR